MRVQDVTRGVRGSDLQRVGLNAPTPFVHASTVKKSAGEPLSEGDTLFALTTLQHVFRQSRTTTYARIVKSTIVGLILAVACGAQSTQSVGSATATTTVLPSGNHEVKVTTGDEQATLEPSNGINVDVPAGGNSATVTLKPGESVKITVGSHVVTLNNPA